MFLGLNRNITLLIEFALIPIAIIYQLIKSRYQPKQDNNFNLMTEINNKLDMIIRENITTEKIQSMFNQNKEEVRIMIDESKNEILKEVRKMIDESNNEILKEVRIMIDESKNEILKEVRKMIDESKNEILKEVRIMIDDSVFILEHKKAIFFLEDS